MSPASKAQKHRHNQRVVVEVEEIDAFVRGFYTKVQDDGLLGPVFDERISNWEPHLQRMIAFWRSVLRAEGLYTVSPKGPPPIIHQGLTQAGHDHFDRWIELFEQTLRETLDEPAADWVLQAALRMRRVLSRHLGPINSD